MILENYCPGVRVEARVPGSIYSDLRRAGILGNIYADKNDVDYRWVAYDNWTYEHSFEGNLRVRLNFNSYCQCFHSVTSDLVNGQRVNLVAEGIDTVSQVEINGVVIGETNNQFVRYVFDVKKHLKVGSNTIAVRFQSAPTYARVQSEQFKKKYNYSVIPGFIQ